MWIGVRQGGESAARTPLGQDRRIMERGSGSKACRRRRWRSWNQRPTTATTTTTTTWWRRRAGGKRSIRDCSPARPTARHGRLHPRSVLRITRLTPLPRPVMDSAGSVFQHFSDKYCKQCFPTFQRQILQLFARK